MMFDKADLEPKKSHKPCTFLNEIHVEFFS